MATAHSTALKPSTMPMRHPLEPRAIGPALALQRRWGAFSVRVETDLRGDTRAYLERRPALAR